MSKFPYNPKEIEFIPPDPLNVNMDRNDCLFIVLLVATVVLCTILYVVVSQMVPEKAEAHVPTKAEVCQMWKDGVPVIGAPSDEAVSNYCSHE